MLDKLKKYKWKNRIILVETPDYKNKKYTETKNGYMENIKEFHKRFVKIIPFKSNKGEFKIHIVGFDGGIKESYNNFSLKKILKLIDDMPMGHLRNI